MMKNALLLLSAAAMAPEGVGATSTYMVQNGQCESHEGGYQSSRPAESTCSLDIVLTPAICT
jgi:hypothetical protein